MSAYLVNQKINDLTLRVQALEKLIQELTSKPEEKEVVITKTKMKKSEGDK